MAIMTVKVIIMILESTIGNILVLRVQVLGTIGITHDYPPNVITINPAHCSLYQQVDAIAMDNQHTGMTAGINKKD